MSKPLTPFYTYNNGTIWHSFQSWGQMLHSYRIKRNLTGSIPHYWQCPISVFYIMSRRYIKHFYLKDLFMWSNNILHILICIYLTLSMNMAHYGVPPLKKKSLLYSYSQFCNHQANLFNRYQGYCKMKTTKLIFSLIFVKYKLYP